MEESPQGLDSLSLSFVEGLYSDYLRNAESVSPDWRSYFEETLRTNTNGAAHSNGHGFQTGPSFSPPSLFSPPRVALAEIDPAANES
ncbi:MAG: hypothetical protein SGJ20_15340, partial [Planctomycetota bacterium]|nr:hypothetical protein [Planctomycetota bacterium]